MIDIKHKKLLFIVLIVIAIIYFNNNNVTNKQANYCTPSAGYTNCYEDGRSSTNNGCDPVISGSTYTKLQTGIDTTLYGYQIINSTKYFITKAQYKYNCDGDYVSYDISNNPDWCTSTTCPGTQLSLFTGQVSIDAPSKIDSINIYCKDRRRLVDASGCGINIWSESTMKWPGYGGYVVKCIYNPVTGTHTNCNYNEYCDMGGSPLNWQCKSNTPTTTSTTAATTTTITTYCYPNEQTCAGQNILQCNAAGSAKAMLYRCLVNETCLKVNVTYAKCILAPTTTTSSNPTTSSGVTTLSNPTTSSGITTTVVTTTKPTTTTLYYGTCDQMGGNIFEESCSSMDMVSIHSSDLQTGQYCCKDKSKDSINLIWYILPALLIAFMFIKTVKSK